VQANATFNFQLTAGSGRRFQRTVACSIPRGFQAAPQFAHFARFSPWPIQQHESITTFGVTCASARRSMRAKAEGRPTLRNRLAGDAGNLGAFGHFATAEKETVAFGRDAISSIPPEALLWRHRSGTLCDHRIAEVQVNADPFFNSRKRPGRRFIPQYLRDMYGRGSTSPRRRQQECFDEYLADARRRLKEKQLKPENT